MWITAKSIIMDQLLSHGIETAGPLQDLCNRWVRQALTSIGVTEGTYTAGQGFLMDTQTGSIGKPDDAHEVLEIFLETCNGQFCEAAYGGHQDITVYSQVNNRFRNAQWRDHSTPLLGEDETGFFLMNGDPNDYKGGYFVYTALRKDEEGTYLIPVDAELAVGAYIDYRLTLRGRKHDRTAVTQQEVQDAYGVWTQQKGDAYGKLKLTPIMQKIAWARKIARGGMFTTKPYLS